MPKKINKEQKIVGFGFQPGKSYYLKSCLDLRCLFFLRNSLSGSLSIIRQRYLHF